MPNITGLYRLIRDVINDRFFPPPDPHPPSISGRTILITGANVGVGFEAALKFVQLDAKRVILGVRSLKKGEDAQAEIERRTGRVGVVEVWHVDMGDYGSVKSFAERVEGVDVVVLNAGVLNTGFERGQYGWEVDLQVNTLSTTLLSILLLPKLRAPNSDFTPILELVSSSNHTLVSVPSDARTSDSPLEFYSDPAQFNNLNQYSISKLFLQFAQTGLVKQLGPVEKSGVEIVSVCPGGARSSIVRGDFPWVVRKFLDFGMFCFLKSCEAASRTYVGAVELGGKGHGRFFRFGRIEEPAPTLIGEQNEKLQEKVWNDILNALRKDIPELDGLLGRLSSN